MRRRRVRMYLIDNPGVPLPSIEGVLVSRLRGEYLLAVPTVHWAAGGRPDEVEGMVAIPRDRVAFYEVLGR